MWGANAWLVILIFYPWFQILLSLRDTVYASKKFWWILIWRLLSKLPNLIPRHLYGMYRYM